MNRRTKQLFSLSLLDLLTSALGAVIFLFIITPKGGESASQARQAMVYFDTTQMKIYGELPDSLLSKGAGDTLNTVLIAYKDLPKPAKQPEKKLAYQRTEPKPKPQAPKPKPAPKDAVVNQSPAPKPVEKPEVRPESSKPAPQPKPDPAPKPVKPKIERYRGDAPNVPCAVSIELNWLSRDDNVDLFVCRGNSCVYGGNKKNNRIGYWG